MDNSTNRRALLTDLSVSVASGAILAVGARLFAAAPAVPLWLALAGTATAAGLAFSLARYRRRTGGQVFVLVSAFAQKHYVAELLAALLHTLDRHGVDVVLKAPARDYSGAILLEHLASVRRRARAYTGGIVMVAEADRIRGDVQAFCRDTGLPVVFLDVPLFPGAGDYPPKTAFVGCRAAGIGAEAARWVLATLAADGVQRPNVLVVGSDEHVDRQRAFASALAERLPDATVTVTDQGLLARNRARDIVTRQLKECARRGTRLDVVYCTNDEMALGAVDAVQERRAAGEDCGDPVVVGVDGTDEALAAIRGGTPLRATVVQDSRKVAETAVRLLLKLRAGERVEVETYLPTVIYP